MFEVRKKCENLKKEASYLRKEYGIIYELYQICFKAHIHHTCERKICYIEGPRIDQSKIQIKKEDIAFITLK